ncbi:MAG TPA: MmcQ/YjbR family DNA-binding protein, partial [Mycobacterium sp.]|nr:MmcQ/YjbR family DNA-binding protein [Mycobacterium sp.]
MVNVEDVRQIASSLPRSYEVVVRDQIKFRVGRIVFVAFSPDETVMVVGFPKEERAAMAAAEPDKFMLPRKSDMRYNWIHVRLGAIDLEELRELVI